MLNQVGPISAVEVQTPQQKIGIIRSPAIEVKKVDFLVAEHEKVDVPVVEPEKVDVSAVEPEKVVPVPVAEVEKAPEVIVPAAYDEKTSDVPAQVNGKVVSDEVKVDSEKLVEGIITQINASLDS
ncbi:hypothetical protein K7X08_000855 [Anisodus acutangulus]|uniref:Uncharacterized protein n=1 Tax=Anisodus acutangulus TaxID=402998 RepID=A0A9Q1RK19_9SOLA|nr:hypothetical protein K7X08_000855 [Anisodus acutangulus]